MIPPQRDLPEPETMSEKVLLSVTLGACYGEAGSEGGSQILKAQPLAGLFHEGETRGGGEGEKTPEHLDENLAAGQECLPSRSFSEGWSLSPDLSRRSYERRRKL